jgi:hypothetical protein
LVGVYFRHFVCHLVCEGDYSCAISVNTTGRQLLP